MQNLNSLLIDKLNQHLNGAKTIKENYIGDNSTKALNPLEVAHDTSRIDAEITTVEEAIIQCEKGNTERPDDSLAVSLEFTTSSNISDLAVQRAKFFIDSENSDADTDEMKRRGTINGKFIANNDIRIIASEISIKEAKMAVLAGSEKK